MTNYDFVVIGGGSAGYASARTAVDLGLKTAVIDSAERLSGLCILRGCMPSKALIETANRGYILRNSKKFGVNADNFQVDFKQVFSRKLELINEFAEYREFQLQTGKFDLIRAHASFQDKNILALKSIKNFPPSPSNESKISFKTCLIATGSRHFFPKVKGLEQVGTMNSDDVLEGNYQQPKSVIVLGGGPIALELAHFFHGIGTEVTIIQRHIFFLRNQDEDGAKTIATAYAEKGIKVFTGTSLKEIQKTPNGKKVIFEQNSKKIEIEAEEIVSAFGRMPNTESLSPENAGLEIGKNGNILANKFQQTNRENIFAAGDVTGPYEVVHIAIEQGEISARNAKKIIEGENKLESIDYHCKLFCVFSEPQFASVGMTENEAKEKGISFLTASYPFGDHGKSLIMNELHGFVKLIVRSDSREIIGATVVGPHASELIHEISVAMHFKATANDLAKIPHYHPTLSEIWTYPAEELGSVD